MNMLSSYTHKKQPKRGLMNFQKRSSTERKLTIKERLMRIPFFIKLNQKYVINNDIEKLVLLLYKYDREGHFFSIVKEHYKEFPKTLQDIVNPRRLEVLYLELSYEEILDILEQELGSVFSRYKAYAIKKFNGDIKSLDNIE